jgi:hypothetical protein
LTAYRPWGHRNSGRRSRRPIGGPYEDSLSPARRFPDLCRDLLPRGSRARCTELSDSSAGLLLHRQSTTTVVIRAASTVKASMPSSRPHRPRPAELRRTPGHRARDPQYSDAFRPGKSFLVGAERRLDRWEYHRTVGAEDRSGRHDLHQRRDQDQGATVTPSRAT